MCALEHERCMNGEMWNKSIGPSENFLISKSQS